MLRLLFACALLSGCAIPSDYPNRLPQSGPTAPLEFPGDGRSEVLLFAGSGSWAPELDSLASVLYERGVTYRQVSSAALDAMPIEELASFSLMIIPGGDAPSITQGMSRATHAKLRSAVQTHGLNYLGFCAGAWLAVAPANDPDLTGVYRIGIADAPLQEETSLAKKGLHFALNLARFPDGTRHELLWYGGPITPNRPGAVIAQYDDGTPAISQLHSGRGLVIVSGLHPTATASILAALGLSSPTAIAPELTWMLIEAAMHGRTLPSF